MMMQLWAAEPKILFFSFLSFRFFPFLLSLLFLLFVRLPLRLHVLCSIHWRSDRAGRQMTEYLFLYERKSTWVYIQPRRRGGCCIQLGICHSEYFNSLHIERYRLSNAFILIHDDLHAVYRVTPTDSSMPPCPVNTRLEMNNLSPTLWALRNFNRIMLQSYSRETASDIICHQMWSDPTPCAMCNTEKLQLSMEK